MKKHTFTIGIIAVMVIAALFTGCVSQTDDSGAVSGEVTPTPATESIGTPATTTGLSYPVVDTGQMNCYNNEEEITFPAEDGAFYGQDAQFSGNQRSYIASDDGLSVYDEVTGLTWQRSPSIQKSFL